MLELVTIQRIFENYIHVATSVDHNPGYLAIGHLDGDYHGIVIRLDRVVGIIFNEYDLSGARMTYGPFANLQNLAP